MNALTPPFFCLPFTSKKSLFLTRCLRESFRYLFFLFSEEEKVHCFDVSSRNLRRSDPLCRAEFLSVAIIFKCLKSTQKFIRSTYQDKLLIDAIQRSIWWGVGGGGYRRGGWVLRTFHGHQKVELTHHEKSDKRL